MPQFFCDLLCTLRIESKSFFLRACRTVSYILQDKFKKILFGIKFSSRLFWHRKMPEVKEKNEKWTQDNMKEPLKMLLEERMIIRQEKEINCFICNIYKYI